MHDESLVHSMAEESIAKMDVGITLHQLWQKECHVADELIVLIGVEQMTPTDGREVFAQGEHSLIDILSSTHQSKKV
tara:strand:- start:291 stop:521 length:231 start_codon:yes stop_codon:yes gene_type:complete